MNVRKKKMEYNLIVEEYQSALVFLDGSTIQMKKKEQAIPKFKKLLREMDEELKLFDKEGIKYTDEEALEGFKL